MSVCWSVWWLDVSFLILAQLMSEGRCGGHYLLMVSQLTIRLMPIIRGKHRAQLQQETKGNEANSLSLTVSGGWTCRGWPGR